MAVSTTNVTISIESDLKKEADTLFADLGMNLSTAFNVFIRQAIRVQGLPFEIAREVPSQEMLKAIHQAAKMAHDSEIKGFNETGSLTEDLNA